MHFIHARRHVLEIIALHHHGDAAGDFDVFDAAAKLGLGLGEGLSVFDSDDPRELLEILFEEVLQLEQVLNALARRCAAPSSKSAGGRLNGSIDIRACREGRARQDFCSRRVENVKVFCCGGSPPSAIHIILKLGYLGGYGTAHIQLLGPDVEWREEFRGPAQRRIGSM